MSDSSTALSPVLQFRQDLQTKLRDGVRRAIETVLDEELLAALGAAAHERISGRRGYRHGTIERTVTTRDGTRAITGRCCTNPHWPARCPPTGFSPADAIRHWSPEGGHPIEDFAAEDHLTPLPGLAPGAKAISDDGLVAEERVLHPALTMVP